MPHPNRVLGALVASIKFYVSEVLQSRGFVITEQELFLLAKKGDVEVAICLIGAGEEKLLPAFLDRFKRFTGKKLVVSVVPVPEIQPERLDGNLIIWDREALAQEIGRTHLERIVGETDHGLVDELVADDYPQMMTQADMRKLEGAEVGERIIRPTIDSRDVKEIGMRTVGGFRQKLELVPYYVFDFSCPIYSGIDIVGEEKGRLGVNALTKRVEPWNELMEVVYSLEQDHRKAKPTFDEQTAIDLAKKEVMRMHSVEREVVRDEGHVTITEKKKVAPRADDVHLESKGIFYLPIWCVEGIHGVMIINAGTGKIVSEDFYRL